MKNKYLFLLLCFCCFLFMGCPYNSPVSIDGQPAVKIDSKLLGKWQLRSSDDATYIVEKKDDYTYFITEKHKPSQDTATPSEDKVYNAFLSDLDGTKFLNLFEPGADTKAFYFYKIEISNEVDAFSLYPVTEYITESFASSADLKKFFQSYKNLSFFYEAKDEYIKVGN